MGGLFTDAGSGIARRAVTAVLCLAMCLPVSALAQFGSLQGLADIQEIVDRKTLRVGLQAADFPPMLVTGAEGQVSGVDVTIAQGLARKLGVQAQYLRAANSTNALVEQVARGEVDIALSLAKTAKRAKYVRFSRPFLVDRFVVGLNRARALRENVSCPRTLTDVVELATADSRLGVMADSALDQLVSDAVDRPRLTRFTEYDALIRAVEAGDLLAAVMSTVEMTHKLAGRPAARIRIELCVLDRPREYLAIAVRPDAPNLAAWIDLVFEVTDLRLDASQPLLLEEDWAL